MSESGLNFKIETLAGCRLCGGNLSLQHRADICRECLKGERRIVPLGVLVELKRVLENAAAGTPTFKMGVKTSWEAVQQLIAQEQTCGHQTVDITGSGDAYMCVKCGLVRRPTPV